ncbi:MAG: hypothetical protein AB1648_10255 [Pseudomonadota bacterium]
MNPSKLEQTHDPDLIHSFAALKRAAQRARDEAARTGTLLVVVRNARCERLPPDQVAELYRQDLSVKPGES